MEQQQRIDEALQRAGGVPLGSGLGNSFVEAQPPGKLEQTTKSVYHMLENARQLGARLSQLRYRLIGCESAGPVAGSFIQTGNSAQPPKQPATEELRDALESVNAELSHIESTVSALEQL